MKLTQLREKIREYIGDSRYLHTLAVERECAALADIYALDAETSRQLAYAALLHDITKEKNTEQQLMLCVKYGLPFSEEDRRAPKTLHALTGAAQAAADFPTLADETVCGCIRWHTTGRAGMTLPEKLLYLADYIEDTRTFPDCVKLRRCFYSHIGTMERSRLLDDILVMSFDMTIRDLTENGQVISTDTIAARNDLIVRRAAKSIEKKDEQS